LEKEELRRKPRDYGSILRVFIPVSPLLANTAAKVARKILEYFFEHPRLLEEMAKSEKREAQGSLLKGLKRRIAVVDSAPGMLT